MEQIITLRVRYEDDPDLTPMDPPALWNWSELAGEDVQVIQALPVTEGDPQCPSTNGIDRCDLPAGHRGYHGRADVPQTWED